MAVENLSTDCITTFTGLFWILLSFLKYSLCVIHCNWTRKRLLSIVGIATSCRISSGNSSALIGYEDDTPLHQSAFTKRCDSITTADIISSHCTVCTHSADCLTQKLFDLEHPTHQSYIYIYFFLFALLEITSKRLSTRHAISSSAFRTYDVVLPSPDFSVT